MPHAISDHERTPVTSRDLRPGSTWTAKLSRWYVVLALGFFNAILLLVLINLALYVVLRLKHPAPKPGVSFTEHFNSDKLQAAYPGWREVDVRALLKETPREDREFE